MKNKVALCVIFAPLTITQAGCASEDLQDCAYIAWDGDCDDGAFAAAADDDARVYVGRAVSDVVLYDMNMGFSVIVEPGDSACLEYADPPYHPQDYGLVRWWCVCEGSSVVLVGGSPGMIARAPDIDFGSPKCARDYHD